MIRSAAILILGTAAIALAACGNDPVCTSAACSAALSFTPAQVTLQATQNLAGASTTATLGSASGGSMQFTIACTNGLVPSPASGSISQGGTQAIAITLPAPSAVAVFTATCMAGPMAGGAANATLSVTVAVSAPISGNAGNSDSGVGINGGSVDHLYFAVIGDSRPNDIDAVDEYPTAVITQIYKDVEALSPKPQFVVGTGDYMYANTDAYTARPQASLYMQARDAWSGAFFPAEGNHECDGYTADNCVLNQTQNNQAFMSIVLAPNQQALPYYSVPINGSDGSWTAKLLVLACNSWDSTQSAWLKAQLAAPTTYTFLVRHEPAEANTGPCVTEVEATMTTAAYDLSLVGHTHYFKGSSNSKEIVVGNGGAPLSGGDFGYVTIERVTSPAAGWKIINYDYASQLPVNTFTIQ